MKTGMKKGMTKYKKKAYLRERKARNVSSTALTASIEARLTRLPKEILEQRATSAKSIIKHLKADDVKIYFAGN